MKRTVWSLAGSSLLLFTGAAVAGGAPSPLAHAPVSQLPSGGAGAVAAGGAASAVPKRISAKEKSTSVTVQMEASSGYATVLPGTRPSCLLRQNGAGSERVVVYASEGVAPIRVERLSEGQLMVETLWIDARTGGTTSAGTETIPLKPLAAPNDRGERVYAYRDDTHVHLVWPSRQQVRWRDARAPLGATSNCGHVHVLLDARDVNGLKSSTEAMFTESKADGTKSTTITTRLAASLSKTTRDREPILTVGVTAHDDRHNLGLGTNVEPPVE